MLERKKLPHGILVRLVRLRACESGGRYHITGHHDGAYQYLKDTWARAQAWYGAPVRYRTYAAHYSSPAHQDAVTGRFWPAHYGEWACRA